MIVALLVFGVTVASAYAQKSNESAMFEKHNLKPIESVFDEQARKTDKETGALRVNRFEYFESEAKGASEIAKKC